MNKSSRFVHGLKGFNANRRHIPPLAPRRGSNLRRMLCVTEFERPDPNDMTRSVPGSKVAPRNNPPLTGRVFVYRKE